MTGNDDKWLCTIELAGWELLFAALALTDDFDPAVLSRCMAEAEDEARRRFAGAEPAADPVLAALRELFKAAGTSPSKYRPSSEALVRRVLKGDALPRINPLVDFNNLLSLKTLCPCCVTRPGSVTPPVVLRRGGPGESITGLRGPFDLEGKPVLVDTRGPFGTPITDDHRVILTPGDRSAVLVVYTPGSIGLDIEPILTALAAAGGHIRVEWKIKFPS